MGAPVKYNANDWSLQLGSYYVTGYDEDMFTIEKDEGKGEYVIGAQGDAIFNETNNTLHTLTVTLQATSPAVAKLLDLFNDGEEFSVNAINKKLGREFVGEYARVTEAPSMEAGAEAGSVEFTIQIADGMMRNC